MIAKPIVPVEAKIVGILKHFDTNKTVSLNRLLDDSVSLPDMIAIFLGVLELVKMRRIILVEHDVEGSVFGLDTEFIPGEETEDDIESEFSSDFDTQQKEVMSHGN